MKKRLARKVLRAAHTGRYSLAQIERASRKLDRTIMGGIWLAAFEHHRDLQRELRAAFRQTFLDGIPEVDSRFYRFTNLQIAVPRINGRNLLLPND